MPARMAYDPISDLYQRGGGTRAYDAKLAIPSMPGLLGDARVDKSSPRPDTPRPELERMVEAWRLADDLIGGKRAMAAGGWLEAEDKEKPKAFRCRLERTPLWSIYEDTLASLVSPPFEQELHYDEPLPPELAAELRNVDGEGRTLSVFARDTLWWMLHRGLAHVLVDADPVPNTAAASGRADLGLRGEQRVYWNLLDPRHVLDVLDGPVPNQPDRAVRYVRFVHCRSERAGFERVRTVQIIELERALAGADTPGTRTVWEWDAKVKRWAVTETAPYQPPGYGIPLFTAYGQQLGAYYAKSPLESLQELNLQHYRSQSDQQHVLRYARLITLVTLGFKGATRLGGTADPEERAQVELTLGPTQRINSTEKDASVEFLEPSGKGIEAGWQDLDRIQEQAERQGARHLTTQLGNVTARASTIDNKKATTNLQQWCTNLEALLARALAVHAAWRKYPDLTLQQLPRTYREFAVTISSDDAGKALQWLSKFLPDEEVLLEAKYRGQLRPGLDVVAAVQKLREQREADLQLQMAQAAGTPGGPPSDTPADA